MKLHGTMHNPAPRRVIRGKGNQMMPDPNLTPQWQQPESTPPRVEGWTQVVLALTAITAPFWIGILIWIAK
jgi:hypothetical protein